jgi:phosphate starvation-inducible protein PhoH
MERHIEVEKMEILINLFGSFDENIRLIEKQFDVAVINRGSEIKIGGEPENVDRAVRVLQNLAGMAHDAIEHLNRQIEAPTLALEQAHHTHALLVVAEQRLAFL